MRPQQVAIISVLSVWGAGRAQPHDKESEKSSIRPESISRHRERRPEHLQISGGKTVFSQGKPADAVFYIQKGKVKITVVSEQGKEAVVAVLGPDEFCGEGCLNGQPVRLATATAMAECEIMRLGESNYDQRPP